MCSDCKLKLATEVGTLALYFLAAGPQFNIMAQLVEARDVRSRVRFPVGYVESSKRRNSSVRIR